MTETNETRNYLRTRSDLQALLFSTLVSHNFCFLFHQRMVFLHSGGQVWFLKNSAK